MKITDIFTPYFLCGFAGFVVSLVTVLLVCHKKDYPKSRGFFLLVAAIIGLFIGGHLLFFIVGLPEFIRDVMPDIHTFDQFLAAFGANASGLVFYGSMLGALLSLYIFCKANHMPLRPNLNLCVLIFPLSHACGRVGCALTGCCYGIEYHGPLAITYTASHIVAGANDDIADFSRFPVQILEAVCELIIFFVLLYFYNKKGDEFSVTTTYLLIYPVVRFFDEFLRGDHIRGLWGPFSTSQWISLAILAVTIIYLIIKKRKSRLAPQE